MYSASGFRIFNLKPQFDLIICLFYSLLRFQLLLNLQMTRTKIEMKYFIINIKKKIHFKRYYQKFDLIAQVDLKAITLILILIVKYFIIVKQMDLGLLSFVHLSLFLIKNTWLVITISPKKRFVNPLIVPILIIILPKELIHNGWPVKKTILKTLLRLTRLIIL